MTPVEVGSFPSVFKEGNGPLSQLNPFLYFALTNQFSIFIRSFQFIRAVIDRAYRCAQKTPAPIPGNRTQRFLARSSGAWLIC